MRQVEAASVWSKPVEGTWEQNIMNSLWVIFASGLSGYPLENVVQTCDDPVYS